MAAHALISSRELNQSFAAEVEKLRRAWAPIKSLHHNLAKKQLAFAKRVSDLWDAAKGIDGAENGDHAIYLRESLRELIGSRHPTTLSKWVQIGKLSEELLTHSSSLPAQRDSLYELARAAKDKEPIKAWIRAGSLSPESSVRDVMALRQKKGKKKKTVGAAARARLVSVTISLKTPTFSDAAQLLKDLISSTEVTRVKCQPGFREAIKHALGEVSYQTVSPKFG